MDTKKKILNIALKVFAWVLVAFTVFMMVFTIVTVTTVDKHDRSIFGVRFYIVQTDSMSLSENNKDMDVHFNAGDIIIARNVEDKTALQAGDIITFISMNDDSYGENITHMIREVQKTDKGEIIGYRTFGTNKNKDDKVVVEPDYVLGQYVGKLAIIGHFFAFVKSTPGYIVCILVPFLLLILYNGVNVIRLFRKYKREQTAEMQAEKDKLEAERAENQRMMQELLALKAQLEQKSGGMIPTAVPASEAIPAEGKPTETKSEATASEEATDEN